MKKICTICGNIVESIVIRECPNCGSFDLRIVQSEEGKIRRFRKIY